MAFLPNRVSGVPAVRRYGAASGSNNLANRLRALRRVKSHGSTGWSDGFTAEQFSAEFSKPDCCRFSSTKAPPAEICQTRAGAREVAASQVRAARKDAGRGIIFIKRFNKKTSV